MSLCKWNFTKEAEILCSIVSEKLRNTVEALNALKALKRRSSQVGLRNPPKDRTLTNILQSHVAMLTIDAYQYWRLLVEFATPTGGGGALHTA
jgi:hypothetical protein